ncbi:aldehyde dehydrogenase family protein [Candidatus Viadribacter manganicus]|uniref:aldehyde dehydrogenase (NAD(+)) n=1 Tax=Candidatus Viadribacter manganicus TaxID=1759059 RepID=A0A1B1AIK0_9PROT|nr:aldehyde dehydrogenase family protein [Candidatus Viadribacter manganicus]ANP46371.1 aldehyde dehydrogenase [Candidatus Viadribacter manganicus]
MREHLNFYIDGKWVAPAKARAHDVINPANEEPIGRISLGSAEDVNKAVAAAKKAFETWSQTSVEERKAILDKVVAVYQRRLPEMAAAISSEMGAPMPLANAAQAPAGLGYLIDARKQLDTFDFEYDYGKGRRILKEPIGVVGMITPWNWPQNQICAKVGAALAAGCTMVLKPSELAPLNGILFAEILDEAGVPPGVFNLVNGDGPGVGAVLSAHPDVDMLSFTGSTRAGQSVMENAAKGIKKVALELGGKSPNIILDDADLKTSVARGMMHMAMNTGQSCNAPSRMLAPKAKYEEVVQIAAATANSIKVQAPESAEAGAIGPLANANQFQKVQGLIQKGIDEGARLAAGGVGRPDGFNRGYYVKPTVFADVNNQMTIAREEIFGPVLVVIPYETEEEAVQIANDTPYGLAAYVQGSSQERTRKVARQLRAGMVHINGAQGGLGSPFGGYKQSGIGREGGPFGLEDFLEVKGAYGWGDQA